MLTEPNRVDIHVGARVRARRIMLQMSEDWLAGMLGVSVSQLSNMEAGKARIDHPTLMSLRDLLDVPERYFYMGFGKQPLKPRAKLPWVRDVDRWFVSHVFPYEALFLKTALRLTADAEAAREIVHEAYAELLTGSRWTGIAFPRSYVMKAIRNLALRRLQRSRVVPIDLLADMDVLNTSDAAPDGYEIVSARQRRAIVLAAIDELPPQCRRVVTLRRLQEMLPRDIAREMGISLSMVEKHLAKGMLHIARRLGEEMSEPGAGGAGETARVSGGE